MKSSIRLRGHHFVCLQFFKGEGYAEDFVDNLTDLVGRMKREPATLVLGADDVCRACPHLSPDEMCSDPHSGESEIARIDALAMDLMNLHHGDTLTLAQASERLADDAVAVGRWRFEACDGCTFEAVCEPGWKRLVGR